VQDTKSPCRDACERGEPASSAGGHDGEPPAGGDEVGGAEDVPFCLNLLKDFSLGSAGALIANTMPVDTYRQSVSIECSAFPTILAVTRLTTVDPNGVGIFDIYNEWFNPVPFVCDRSAACHFENEAENAKRLTTQRQILHQSSYMAHRNSTV
jgi:hypothetical protein